MRKIREKYDKIIIGAGIYGLYSALKCSKQGQRVLVLECDDNAFMRATYINQARVHRGYHYPRSKMTALKSAYYFQRFCDDFGFCINKGFKQIYATSTALSWTNAYAFQKFCEDSNIPYQRVDEKEFFQTGLCDGAFLTEEYTFDALMLRDHFLKELDSTNSVDILYRQTIEDINELDDKWIVISSGMGYLSPFILNATYAGINEIQRMVGYETFDIKHELCEIILCKASDKLKNIGLTVMDGPFFSIMPFGKTGYHSLTSVTFTPHFTSYEETASFECQARRKGECSPCHLLNCNECFARPKSSWNYMSQLAKKYLLPDFSFTYIKSLFSMKPILKAAEIDDSRPTVIKVEKRNPTFVSAFSGKINTIYDLDEVLK